MVRVVFVHPDLGIGGAERAVVDAALALKSRGHSVTFLTAHHDPSHCFQETRDGTLEVSVWCCLPQRMVETLKIPYIVIFIPPRATPIHHYPPPPTPAPGFTQTLLLLIIWAANTPNCQ